jgi:hypothetical protein
MGGLIDAVAGATHMMKEDVDGERRERVRALHTLRRSGQRAYALTFVGRSPSVT